MSNEAKEDGTNIKGTEEIKAYMESVAKRYADYVPLFQRLRVIADRLEKVSGAFTKELLEFRDVLDNLTEENDCFDMLMSLFNAAVVEHQEMQAFLVGIHQFRLQLCVTEGAINGKGGVMISVGGREGEA